MSETAGTGLVTDNRTQKTLASKVELPDNFVDFNGPADLENALNWPQRRKWTIVFVTSCMTFTT